MSFEDLLLIGGMMMALVMFSSKHAQAAPLIPPPSVSAVAQAPGMTITESSRLPHSPQAET